VLILGRADPQPRHDGSPLAKCGAAMMVGLPPGSTPGRITGHGGALGTVGVCGRPKGQPHTQRRRPGSTPGVAIDHEAGATASGHPRHTRTGLVPAEDD